MLPLRLNPSLDVPLYRQLADGVKSLVTIGTLHGGALLPSIREMAAQLRINPSSVVRAYRELELEGVIVMDPRRGTFISERPDVPKRVSQDLLRTEATRFAAQVRPLGLTVTQIVQAVRDAIGEAK